MFIYDWSIKNIVGEVLCVGKIKNKKIVYDITKPESVPYRIISRNKLDSLYGKFTYTSPTEGLKKTIEWIKGEIDA